MADDDLVYLLRRSVEEQRRMKDARAERSRAPYRDMADGHRGPGGDNPRAFSW
ncbi:hypothetical protein PQ455_10300 [Sphingomonas naphthae]|uniref:DUF3563 domain-containing protein n=1 Tax=Sphingomonas naphthae TaxID=1813468 RepID=A0ABY7TGQ9_9SPHN|nr:hypothetical protein [Sphingomonas naphthae]WCT72038.1 hypothetical protein PQ455_10300 [Sphingomonas naphthae]